MVFADYLQIFMTPFGIPIAALVGVFGYLSIQAIAQAVSKVMCNRNDTDLKLELLARGMTAEEIARVVEAGRDEEPAAHPTRAAAV